MTKRLAEHYDALFHGALPSPMLPSLGDAPFDSADWLFELKWDGVRAICLIAPDGVTAVSRTGRTLLPQFPELEDLRRSFRRLPVVVDGEIVSLDRKGRSSFQRLQPRINRIRPAEAKTALPVHFAVFDLLGREGIDLRSRPLDERKSMLADTLRDDDHFTLLSKHVDRTGKALFARAGRLGVEGIVAKRKSSAYQSGRTRDWLKLKTLLRQEFVIGGWTQPQGSRRFIGALLLGLYAGGKLTYAGHVGTGMSEAVLADLFRRLRPLETSRCPFVVPPEANATVHWVRPTVVAEIKFGEWTDDGVLRHPVYLGLRDDKPPMACVREGRAGLLRARKAASRAD